MVIVALKQNYGLKAMKAEKVFGIGLHRTGTTSLRHAFNQLGYDTTPPWRWTGRYNHTLNHEDVAKDALHLAERYDAGGYMPFSPSYKELYQQYPDAKFILTVRNEKKWLKSMFNFFGYYNWPEIRYPLGADCKQENAKILTDAFMAHNKEVWEFFADKPGSLLEMDISRGDGWKELCTFLDKEVPNGPFPKDNSKDSLYGQVVKRAIPTISTIKTTLGL
jgi:hypothetical protein